MLISKYIKITLYVIFVFLLLLSVFLYFYIIFPLWGIPFNWQRHGNPPLTPAWALEPWIWEDDVKTASFVREMIDGYLQHDYPVGAYLIDAPWATRNNDFVINEERYPNPKEFFKSIKDQGIRLAFWMTPNINSQSKEMPINDSQEFYEEARRKGYLIDRGGQIRWWRGKGGRIDYTNPEAIRWWRSLQQNIFDLGLDAWKLDDTSSYPNMNFIGKIPGFYHRTFKGWITTRTYMDHYYRDEYQHGLTQNPEFVTLGRSIDSVIPWAHPEGFAPIDAAPITWVGDNKHTWSYKERGLERAIWCILRSAKLGYNLPGSDIGGYHGGMPIQPELYIRWAQFATFSGFFLNGGHGERRMWKRSQQELEIIRIYSWLRSELVPYIYCYVVKAHQGGRRLILPIKGKYHYLFGDFLCVAPIYQDSPTRTITLPEGRWRYWFDDQKVLEGRKTFNHTFPLHEFPVYVRDGAIIPMKISRRYTGIGDESWSNFLVLNIYPYGFSEFFVYHPDKSGELNIKVQQDNPLQITMEGVGKPHILRILLEKKPLRVQRNNVDLTENDWVWQEDKQRLIIRSEFTVAGTYKVFLP